jgi:hypothetical protein
MDLLLARAQDAGGPEGRSVMRTRNGFLLAVTVTSIGLLLFGFGTLSAKPDKPNPHKPVPATDVVLVEKMSLTGKRTHETRRGRKNAAAATGILGSPCSGGRYAVVVGVSNYVGLANDLHFADDDAALMTQVLYDAYAFDEVITLTGGYDPKLGYVTRTDVMNAIDAVRAMAYSANDEVVFFYSGHGMSGIAEDGDDERVDEAIVVNVPPFNLDPIWDGELREAFSDFATSRIIFIFDMCMAGGMDDLEQPGRVVLMASGERGYAWEGEEWAYGDYDGNGEFTYYLARGIWNGEASAYNYFGDGLSWIQPVTVEEAFDFAKANCREDKPVIADDFPYDLLP